MTRTQRLNPVIHHTDKKQQEALKAVAISQQALDQERLKLSQLKSYKLEYEQRHAQENHVYQALELNEFKRFLAQLDNTISQQQQVIDLRVRELEHKRGLWQTTRVNSKVIHKVVENIHRQVKKEEQKIEQKVMDEFSQRKFTKV